jgi:ubiquinone/menaquinone biosynthesis C-methylase UbiE
MPKLKCNIPNGFDSPIALPRDEDEERLWQDFNRSWWEAHPMTYDWAHKFDFDEFSKEFYFELDRRFFLGAQEYMPWNKIPFDPLIDFNSLRDKDVLEIGVGSGSHAQLLAHYSKSFTGIDITDYAVNSTSKRMKLFGYNAEIIRMDAEQMIFDDNNFDFIWSWGVIHHSSNTNKILAEMSRVLRPGGKAIVMVYHRSYFSYYIVKGLISGILLGDLFRAKSIHKTAQYWTDGAIARYYSAPEWKKLCSEFFHVENMLVFGQKSGLIPLPAGKMKDLILRIIPNPLSRFLTNAGKMGEFLVAKLENRSTLEKIGSEGSMEQGRKVCSPAGILR